MKHRIIVAVLGALFLAAVIEYAVLFRPISSDAEPQVSSVQDPIIAEMISKINQSEIFNTVYDLQNFTTRKYGTEGNLDAGTYLYNRLDDLPRLSVEFQGSYRNVIATLAGTDPTSTATYIVGAHYDSTSSDPEDAPGATDNGGGVAVVLELARIMSRYEFQHTFKFALWNDEEDSLRGSTDYAQYASNNGLNISLYFNYDSSVYDPDSRLVLDIMYNSQSSWVKDVMTGYNTLYAIGFDLTYNVHTTCSSDHKSFWNRGYTAVMTHAETHGPAHSPEDTIDKVSTLYAKKNGQLGMAVLAELAEVQGLWSSADALPPHISILSPTNKTYSVNTLPLMFALNESTSWTGYKIDSREIATISGNATLVDLSDGVHTIVVYANDTVGHMGQSDAVYFTVDTTPPIGGIIIAEGATYTRSTSITLTLSAEDATSSIAQMRFRNDDNATWSNWRPYITSESWNLSTGDGTKTVIIQLSDSAGLISLPYQDTIILDTKEPTANAGINQTVNEGTVVTLDASGSQDENGIASYTWTFPDVTTQTSTGTSPTYTFSTPGAYAITLNVTDAAGNWATDTVTITVLDITKPVANAGQDQAVNLGSSVPFDAGSSNDNVGIVAYTWDFGDGTTGTGKTTTHTYTSPGTYAVTLTVKDSANNSASHSITVTVHSSEAFPMWTVGAAVVIVAAITLAVAVAAAILLRRQE